MTASEFKYEFLQEYDKVANLSSPSYEDDEISLFLTKGQERLVKRHYEEKSNRLREGFDSTEKRKKDLSELISDSIDLNGVSKITVSTNQNGSLSNGVFYDLPTDLLYVVSEVAKLDIKDCDDNNIVAEVEPVTYDEFTSNIKNPFKKPYKDLVWRLDYSKVSPNTGKKRHELVTDGTYNILSYRMRYIRKPKPIIVSDLAALPNPKTIEGISAVTECELDSSLHREIISEAVSLALEVSQEKRYQTQRQETQLTE